MNTIKLKFNKKDGISIVETIVYLSIFTTMSIVVINSFMIIISSLSSIRTNYELLDSASVAMDRISYEIRKAKSVDVANTPTGGSVLQLNSTDDAGNSVIIKFSKDGNDLDLYKDSNLIDNLLTQNISLNNIIFTPISGVSSQGVRVQMTLQNMTGKINRTENFYNTLILRGGY